ncbi:MAG: DUF4278 domain-containing protein [Cyanobacteria bacterium P01_G01_bin.39]
MQLCYRGSKYQPEISSINSVESDVSARFLGRVYTIRYVNYSNPLQSNLYKYRGIIYQK